jgi:hypothetical protein
MFPRLPSSSPTNSNTRSGDQEENESPFCAKPGIWPPSPLSRDVAAVKLDTRHYSFSLTVPASADDPAPGPLHYGLTLSVAQPISPTGQNAALATAVDLAEETAPERELQRPRRKGDKGEAF